MADPPAVPAKGGSKSSFGFLTRKIGPAPVWVWGAIAFGGYYWYAHYGPGKSKAAPRAAGRPGGGRTVIEVRGPRGPAGPPGPGGGEDWDDHHRRRRHHRRRLPPWRFPGEGAAPPAMEVPEPVPAAAPMTGAGIYGDVPVATSEGTFYDSGQPLEGQYVPAG